MFITDVESASPTNFEQEDIPHTDSSETGSNNNLSIISGNQFHSTASLERSSQKRPARANGCEQLYVSTKAEKGKKSAFETFGNFVADRLREIKPNQLKYDVYKLVCDALFKAEMESLNENWEIMDSGRTYSSTLTHNNHIDQFYQQYTPLQPPQSCQSRTQPGHRSHENWETIDSGPTDSSTLTHNSRIDQFYQQYTPALPPESCQSRTQPGHHSHIQPSTFVDMQTEPVFNHHNN